MPVWMWLVIAGIVSSGFMTVKTAREDRKQEMAWIEEEGKKYMNRMEEEKRKRNQSIKQEEEIKPELIM